MMITITLPLEVGRNHEEDQLAADVQDPKSQGCWCEGKRLLIA
jgi:hypothetical protein